jgi:hypothetical protein
MMVLLKVFGDFVLCSVGGYESSNFRRSSSRGKECISSYIVLENVFLVIFQENVFCIGMYFVSFLRKCVPYSRFFPANVFFFLCFSRVYSVFGECITFFETMLGYTSTH